MMHQHGSRKHQVRRNGNQQASVQPDVEVALPSTSHVKGASPVENGSTGGVELMSACLQYGQEANEPSGRAADMERKPLKLYADISSPVENDLYKILAQAFSERDPWERPWCGLIGLGEGGAEVSLLGVSSTNLTVADIRKPTEMQQAVVHVPQNWREPWYVETTGSAKHSLSDNPCDRAERAISSLKHCLASSRASEDPLACPPIKYLVVFPDGYRFQGPKEFSIIEREEVLRLQLRNLRDLPAAILAPTQQQKLDSRNYRYWLESTLLKKSDESIVGTWLDPQYEKPEPQPDKKKRWRLNRLSQKVSSEKQEASSTNRFRVALFQQNFNWGRSKLIAIVVTGMIAGIGGWRLSDANKSPRSLPRSNPSISVPQPENPVNSGEVAKPESRVLPQARAGHEIEDAVQMRQSSKSQETELKKHNQRVERAKNVSDQSPPTKDSELKRRKIELQIDQAIRRRAITGVTVHFAGSTVHLTGRVATESQKSVAENAARGMKGVDAIRNSIETDSIPISAE